MRSSLLRVLASWCCLTVCVVWAAGIDLFGTHAFVGTFVGDDMTLTLELVDREPGPDGSSTYSGSMRYGDQTYPVSATLVHSMRGTITGSLESAGQSFGFEATLSYGTLTFVTGRVSYRLVEQGQPEDGPLAYRSERHGFGLHYPLGWIVTEEPDAVTFASPDGDGVSFVVYAPLRASQAGAEERYLFELPLGEVANLAIEGLQQELASLRLLEPASFIRLFAPAVRVRFTAVDPDTGQEMVAHLVMIRTEDALYSLAFGYPSPVNLGHEMGFDVLLRSFGVFESGVGPEPLTRPEPDPPPGLPRTGESVRLARSYVIDPFTSGSMFEPQVSHTFLLPEGWQQQGGVWWRDSPFPFSALDLAIFDPHSGLAVRFLGFPHFTWYEPNSPGYAPGQLAGTARIAMPPLRGDPQAFLQHVVFPQHFPHVSGLSIVDVVPMPGVAEEAYRDAMGAGLQGPQVAVESYRARLHYEQDGVALEEDVYFTLVFVYIPSPYAAYYTPNPWSPGLTSTWSWYPTELFGLRANRGQLDASTPLLRALAASIRVDRTWFAINLTVHQQHDQAIISAGRRLGDVLTELHVHRQHLADMLHGQWVDNQRSQDRIHDAFSQYIRGTQTYQGPGGERVELPAHYPSVWQQQGGGAYIMSMDPSFDPHAVTGGSWWQMR